MKFLYATQSFIKKTLSQLRHFSLAQKVTLVYICILLLIVFLAPLIQLTLITTTEVNTFGIGNGLMTKTAWMVYISILHLFIRNISESWRNKIYTVFGLQCTLPLANVFHLVVIFLILGSVSDTIQFVSYHISQNISVTIWWFLLSIWVFLGIIWQLMIARMQWKQKVVVHDHIASTTHHLKKEDFYHESPQETLL